MDCSKNRLSSGVDDPDMEVGSVRARPRDVFGISVLLTLLLAILLAMWTVGLEDPHGLSHATPVRAADVPSLEPLYGAVQTPWRSLDWSPDGRQIALTGEADGVTIVEAATGQVAAHWKVPAYTNVIRWSPDGSHLAVGGWTGIVGPGWVYVYTAEGFLERSWEAHSREVGGLAWAPNGTWLATAANARFAIWEAGTGVLVRRVLNASVWGEAADWSPDGHYLAFDAVGGPSIYDAITGGPVFISPSKETLDVRPPAWSHAGDRIASSNLVGCTRVVTRDGTSVWSYDMPSSGSCDDTWFTRRPSWSPSDDLLAVPTSPGIRVFDAATGTLLRVLAFPVGDYGPSTVIGNYAPGDSRDIDV
ncbi:MAG: WD40 repeat domain-containing protein, partial [Methanobacteriota archaeon]